MTEHAKPCETWREAIELLVGGELDDRDTVPLLGHLGQCAGCREYWRRLVTDDRDLVTFARTHADRVADVERRALVALEQLPDRTPTRPAAAPATSWWRWPMQTRTNRFVTGAVAAAAVLLVMIIVDLSSPAFSAWADVLETVRQAGDCVYRVRNLDRDDIDAVHKYGEHGVVNETWEDGQLVEAVYVDFEQRTTTYVLYPLDLAVRMSYDEAYLAAYARQAPAALFEFLGEYEQHDLGRRTIDGVKAAGIRVTDARLLAERLDRAELELWVDPETKLPVRFDVEGEAQGGRSQRHVRFYDFDWDVEVTAADVSPLLPSGIKVVDAGRVAMDTDHLVATLRAFAERLGRYPRSLAWESLLGEMRSALGRGILEPEPFAEAIRSKAGCTFYGYLVSEDREVLYLGDRVRPGDGDRLLMRWRDDDGQWRVVMGDLSVRTVPGVEVLELEGR